MLVTNLKFKNPKLENLKIKIFLEILHNTNITFFAIIFVLYKYFLYWCKIY